MRSRPIYLAIMDAAARRRGLRLSAAEVRELSSDDAVATRAAVECQDDGERAFKSWTDEYRRRRAALKMEGRDG